MQEAEQRNGGWGRPTSSLQNLTRPLRTVRESQGDDFVETREFDLVDDKQVVISVRVAGQLTLSKTTSGPLMPPIVL